MLATGPKYYAEQQKLAATAVRQLRTTGTTPEALRLLSIYQANAALNAMEFGTDALAEQDIPNGGAQVLSSAFTVDPSAPSVLDDVRTQFEFDRIVATLVSDAGRSAMGAFTASRTQEVGTIRVLTPPSCARCAILAGRWYRWSDGFQRHPKCDCQNLPGTRAAATWDPHAAYEKGQITDLTKAQRDAIDAGADIGQVINSRRGMQTINFAGRRVQVTTEGTTSQGIAFGALERRGGSTQVDAGFADRITRQGRETRAVTRTVARAPRLSPEAIYRVSDDDRDMAIRLLRANGYIL